MAKWVVVTILLVAVALGVAFVYFYQPQREALAEARREASLCVQERSALQRRVADLEGMLGELQQTSAELEAQVTEKKQQLAEILSTRDELVEELKKEIADGQVQVKRLRGELRVDMVNEILFDSGEATLKAAGRDLLMKVAEVVKKANRHIEVQGHTDNVPIRGKLAERYPTNWELSAARAINVARFLQEKAALDPRRLSASAFSEYRPRADNDSKAGRQKNRRIEILLVPLIEAEPQGEGAAENQPPVP
ncbi:MAG: OmpA family protein [Acidobacteriota bacterium]